MQSPWTLAAIVLTVICVDVRMTGIDGGPPITSNHSLTDTSAVSSTDMSSGLMDLPSPGGAQDPQAELDGTIKNSTSGIRRIRDVKIWLEDGNGNKLKDANAQSPISGLATAAGSGTPGNAATLVSRAGGVSTFNLADDVNRGQFISYAAQVDHFNEPANYKVKMAFSQANASAKHFEILGMAQLSHADDAGVVLDGLAPTVRSGVLISVKNVSGARTLKGATVTLVSHQQGLAFSGATVLDQDDKAVDGASLSISDDGRTATLGGVSLENPALLNLWLDLNEPYGSKTVFTLTGRYD